MCIRDRVMTIWGAMRMGIKPVPADGSGIQIRMDELCPSPLQSSDGWQNRAYNHVNRSVPMPQRKCSMKLRASTLIVALFVFTIASYTVAQDPQTATNPAATQN